MVVWPGRLGGPGAVAFPFKLLFLFREARIMEKCSAAEMISLRAMATSSRLPVTTKTGSSPRTGVLIYVLVFARRALILQPTIVRKTRKKAQMRQSKPKRAQIKKDAGWVQAQSLGDNNLTSLSIFFFFLVRHKFKPHAHLLDIEGQK